MQNGGKISQNILPPILSAGNDFFLEKKTMFNKSRFQSFSLAILAASLTLACQKDTPPPAAETPPPVAAPQQYATPAAESPKMLLADFTGLMEKEGASVVSITAQGTARRRHPLFDDDDPMLEFFRRFAPENPRVQQNAGSGFIVSSDGFILTNAHVVAQAQEIFVNLPQQNEAIPAKLMGQDPRTDVALLKIEKTNLPAVKIGNPTTLKVGEWVAAIGAPFGFDNTITAGIVSAKGRSLPEDNYVQFIQTDVAVNPGNSGGPLFNLNGEVVGINSQIYSRSGGFMGISFAIPIDIAMQVADQLKTHGRVRRGQLGVHIQEMSPELAKSMGLKHTEGALIVFTPPQSPAAKAGILAGDVILKVNGKAVKSSRELPLLIGSFPPNSTLTLELWRNNQSLSVDVTLAELQ